MVFFPAVRSFSYRQVTSFTGIGGQFLVENTLSRGVQTTRPFLSHNYADPLGSPARQDAAKFAIRSFRTCPPISARKPNTKPRDPQELFPESYPRFPEELVNPSGRIYSVRQPLDEEERSKEEKIVTAQRPPILRAIIWAAAVSSGLFFWAATVTVKDTQRATAEIHSQSGPFGNFTSFFGSSGAETISDSPWAGTAERQLRAFRKHELAEKLGWRLTWLLGWCDQLHLPVAMKQFVGKMYTWGAESYLNLPDAQRCVLPVITTNTAIFLAWRFSSGSSSTFPLLRTRMYDLMTKYFLHTPSSGRVSQLLTSVFSHRGGLHFLFNNFALWSFGAGAILMPFYYDHSHIAEANPVPHYLAFFAAAGIFSSLTSHLVTAASFRAISISRSFSTAQRSLGYISSLGSSGALYSAIVMHAMTFPDQKISLIFLPMFPIPIDQGVAMLVLFDIVGLLARWRSFDHAAHLGGALFGYLYYHYGREMWEKLKHSRIQQSKE